jgi:sugar phosphate isomerase/epimerase
MIQTEPNARKSSISRRRFFKMAGAASLLASGSAACTVAQEGTAKSGSRGKAKFKLGLASYTLRKFDLDDTLAMTKRLGLEYVCFKSFHLPLDASSDEIAATVAKVKEAGLILYGGGVIGMKTEDQVNQAFEYTKAAGMTTIVGVPAPELLGLVEKKVKEYDIQVAIHNHGPGDKIYPTPQAAYEKIADLDKRIGLCIDIGHTVRYGEDAVETTRKCADRILDVHLKDVTEASAAGRACPAGHGVIDLPAFLKTLMEIGFSGVAAFEYEADPDDPLPGLAESVGYVRGVLAVIG